MKAQEALQAIKEKPLAPLYLLLWNVYNCKKMI